MNQSENEGKIPLLHSALDKAAKAVSAESSLKYGSLWGDYLRICEVLSKQNAQGSENPQEVSVSVSQRISITAGLLQSVVVVEKTISSGYYWAATAIIRQHMEALARVMQIRKGEYDETKTPHVGILPGNLKENYGRLSDFAHLTSGELLADFAQGKSNYSAEVLPRYMEEYSKSLLSVHVQHLTVLSEEINQIIVELRSQ